MNKIKIMIVIILILIFSGCKEKNHYDTYYEYPDNKSDDEESGCGIKTDNYEKNNDSQIIENDENHEDTAVNDKSWESDFENEDMSNDDNDATPDENNDSETCPTDMVETGTVCVDRYEASRIDATENSQGTSTVKAVSKKGVMPWMENPMSKEVFETFKKACKNAGKYLCKDTDWIEACKGPDESVYSWGNSWERKICNNVDTFCDDYCFENGIEDCSTSSNCGYEYYCFKPVMTGTFEKCKNYSGIFDINGNVWEITDAGNDYKVRGGAFNCAGAEERLKCTYSAGWSELFAGFRCCKNK